MLIQPKLSNKSFAATLNLERSKEPLTFLRL